MDFSQSTRSAGSGGSPGIKSCLCIILAFAFCTVTGCGQPSLLITPVQNANQLVEQTVQPGKGWDKIAIIEVEGMLLNSRGASLLGSTENKVSLFTQQMERAASDKAVKAVVLRINSPGGTVTASDTMYEIVKRFRQNTGKPVIASAQEVATSGAYYVACAADQIVVHPTSVVGSIGVIFNTMEFSGTLAKIGASTDSVKSGKLKDMGSPFKRLSAEERAVMQGMVDEYFQRFKTIVASERKISDSSILETATDGRVFTGRHAVEMGLADRTGLLEDALRLAREKSKSANARAVLYTRPHGFGGSIYASGAHPPAESNVLQLQLPESSVTLPGGFYYLWQP